MITTSSLRFRAEKFDSKKTQKSEETFRTTTNRFSGQIGCPGFNNKEPKFDFRRQNVRNSFPPLFDMTPKF
jgi:hypothetical protein